MKERTVLVAGAAGFSGSFMIEILITFAQVPKPLAKSTFKPAYSWDFLFNFRQLYQREPLSKLNGTVFAVLGL